MEPPMDSAPKLSLIVPHFRNPDGLRQTLRSLRDSVAPLKPEIIVVDSGADGSAASIVSETLSEARLIAVAENLGYPKTVNTGIRASTGEFLAVVNARMEVTAGALERMVEFFEREPSAGLVGAKILRPDGNREPSCFRFYRPWTILFRRTFLGKLPFAKRHLESFLLADKNLTNGPRTVDWVMGSGYMVRREAINRVGFLDDRFFMYFEDVDWCWRFWENGYTVWYLPEAVLIYEKGERSKKEGGYRRIHISSGFKYLWKHGLGLTNPKRSADSA